MGKMGKHHKTATEKLTKLEEVGRRQFVLHYTEGMSIEELIRIAIERASELAVAIGKSCQISFDRDDITVIVNEQCIFQPVLRRFKYAMLTMQSPHEEDRIDAIGPDYPDHLSHAESAKAKEIQLLLRRQAKADAKKRRRQHHKAGRDARAANDRSRRKPTTKARCAGRKARHDSASGLNHEDFRDNTEALKFEEINAHYDAMLARAASAASAS